jgi:hypothetical protein
VHKGRVRGGAVWLFSSRLRTAPRPFNPLPLRTAKKLYFKIRIRTAHVETATIPHRQITKILNPQPHRTAEVETATIPQKSAPQIFLDLSKENAKLYQ